MSFLSVYLEKHTVLDIFQINNFITHWIPLIKNIKTFYVAVYCLPQSTYDRMVSIGLYNPIIDQHRYFFLFFGCDHVISGSKVYDDSLMNIQPPTKKFDFPTLVEWGGTIINSTFEDIKSKIISNKRRKISEGEGESKRIKTC